MAFWDIPHNPRKIRRSLLKVQLVLDDQKADDGIFTSIKPTTDSGFLIVRFQDKDFVTDTSNCEDIWNMVTGFNFFLQQAG